MEVDSDSESTPSRSTRPMRTVLQQAEAAILKQLGDAIGEHEVTSRYCCGGTILPSLNATVPGESLQELASAAYSNYSTVNQFTLRFDDPFMEGISRRVTFPMRAEDVGFNNLDHLLKATQNSACGKFGILSTNQFSIDFDPHRSGLLDVAAQVLLPGFECEMLKRRPEHRGVRASAPILLVVPESTDKVNIPFGYHPKTPNSLGKLLICLPTTHQGGKWEITQRHTEASTTFECTSSNLNHLQWAACLGSCQYSIHTMQGSHQLILLYNLEVSERVGCLLRKHEPGQGLLAMPWCFPLHASVKNMLQNPGFMKDEGKLGFYCRYPYLHTKPKTQNLMPYELKGIDMVVYSLFRSLGLKAIVRPLLDCSAMKKRLEHMDEHEYELQRNDYYENPIENIHLAGFPRPIEMEILLEFKHEGHLQGFPSFEWWKERRDNASRVGVKFHPLRFCKTSPESTNGMERMATELGETWIWDKVYDVMWVNTPVKGTRELALINLPEIDRETLGESNDKEREIERHNSHVVMIVWVPEFRKRNLTGA